MDNTQMGVSFTPDNGSLFVGGTHGNLSGICLHVVLAKDDKQHDKNMIWLVLFVKPFKWRLGWGSSLLFSLIVFFFIIK
jgi:hypothetical protein